MIKKEKYIKIKTTEEKNYNLFFSVLTALRHFNQSDKSLDLVHHILLIIIKIYDLKIILSRVEKDRLELIDARLGGDFLNDIVSEKVDLYDKKFKDLASIKALEKKQPFGYKNIWEINSYKNLFKIKNNFQSTYAFPILVNGEIEMLVNFFSNQKNFFTPFMVELFNKIIIEVGKNISDRQIMQKYQDSLLKYEIKLKEKIKELEKDKKIMEKQTEEMEKVVKELEISKEKTEKAGQAKMDFFASISHELRTPLNAILGFTQVMDNQTFGKIENRKYREYIKYILMSAQHLLSLINDILDFSKMDAGKQNLIEKVILLNPLIKEVVSLIKKYPEADKRKFYIKKFPKILP